MWSVSCSGDIQDQDQFLISLTLPWSHKRIRFSCNKYSQNKIVLALRIKRESASEIRIRVYDIVIGEDQNIQMKEKETQLWSLSPVTLDDRVQGQERMRCVTQTRGQDSSHWVEVRGQRRVEKQELVTEYVWYCRGQQAFQQCLYLLPSIAAIQQVSRDC